ncbi:hypothetical protein MSG28_002883 [Choristoneura fumiferana]|uniref:Uncharacterized protein n=2 Tax=Choristoneura fumiferana TaxID=7141 RepID=A0ACC0JJL9_CHOFU|nr:hypothetical protein MSG28_002883 [Choristoneura fumiferana]
MVDMRKRAMKDEMKRNLEYERKMQTMDSPWGKPGPGGTTWRNPRNVGLNFSNSMGWTDNDIFTKLHLEHKRYKRSSLALPNVKRDDDSKEKYTSDKETMKSNDVKLPDIKQTNSPKTKCQEEHRKEPNKTSNGKELKEDGSATIVKEKVKSNKKKKFVKRLSNGEKIKRLVPEDDDKEDGNKGSGNVRDGNQLTPEERILRMTGGVELVPLLARRRRVGARTLHSSDVTRPPDQLCQWREILNEDYLRELKHQMTVKSQKKEETRLNSAESVRLHHATWESLWGRPGHGAPQRGRYARSNLARLLYVTPLVNK